MILSDTEIEALDCIELDEFDYIKESSITRFARAIERAVIQKIKAQGAVAVCDTQGRLMFYDDSAGRKYGSCPNNIEVGTTLYKLLQEG